MIYDREEVFRATRFKQTRVCRGYTVPLHQRDGGGSLEDSAYAFADLADAVKILEQLSKISPWRMRQANSNALHHQSQRLHNILLAQSGVEVGADPLDSHQENASQKLVSCVAAVRGFITSIPSRTG